jgi:hypothetical protein
MHADINIGAFSFCYFMFIGKKEGVTYVGIWRVCTAVSAMISGETTSTPLGSIGSCFAWQPLGRIDRCPAYAGQVFRVGVICGGGGDGGGEKGVVGGIFLHCGSSRLASIDNDGRRRPTAATGARPRKK